MAMLYVDSKDWYGALINITGYITLFSLDDEAISIMYYLRGISQSNLLVDPKYAEFAKTMQEKEKLRNNACNDILKSCSLGFKDACDWPYDDCK